MLEEFDAAAPKPKPHTLNEREFCQTWISLLSGAMLKTGKGFRMDSPRRVPPRGASQWRGERRADKVGTTKLSRRLMTGVV
jgi:hypothetical protein